MANQLIISPNFYIRAVTAAQIKNSFTSIGEIESAVAPSYLLLKLSVTKNALVYFVLSKTHNQIIFYGNYTLHHVNTAAELAERVEKLFERDEILQLNFSEVLVGVDSRYSLVPAEFSFLKNFQQQSQHSEELNLDLVYADDDVVKNTLNRLFRNIHFSHLNFTFLQSLRAYLLESTDKLFVNLSAEHLDIIRFDEEKNLQLMNRYNFSAASDFIYFVLLACEDLKIDREKTELVLSGEVDIQSKIYDMCYRYFRNISFITKPEGILFTTAFEMFPKHLHFNLYNLKA